MSLHGFISRLDLLRSVVGGVGCTPTHHHPSHLSPYPGLEGPLTMASGAGKAAQPPGPGSAVNGTAAELSGIEQELYDDQMHSKMCKKIAQLTKVRAAPPGNRRPAVRVDGMV